MKKFIITLIFGLLISSSVLARSTGCKEGNCDNGYGKWVAALYKDMNKSDLLYR